MPLSTTAEIPEIFPFFLALKRLNRHFNEGRSLSSPYTELGSEEFLKLFLFYLHFYLIFVLSY